MADTGYHGPETHEPETRGTEGSVTEALEHGSHAGRASSWAAVSVMLLGFLTGGIALCLGPNWLFFWIGAGLVALGGILALAFDIFSDVIVDAPRVISAAEHHSPFERGQ
ncbi:HGxxPAAW family protein [Spongiactinospora sp. 9N601]|uniref:HGxxPAAW family protein n=1 Tax=Spongiactinospora sp. 9N601 TaxID=3375149 RepID=UPI0037AF7D22